MLCGRSEVHHIQHVHNADIFEDQIFEGARLEEGQAMEDVGQRDLKLVHGAVVGLGELLAGVALKALLVQHTILVILVVIMLHHDD